MNLADRAALFSGDSGGSSKLTVSTFEDLGCNQRLIFSVFWALDKHQILVRVVV